MTNVELARACASLRRRGRKPCCCERTAVLCDGRQLRFRARTAAARKATDLSVAQAVKGQGEDLAGDSDLRELPPAAFRDPLEPLAHRSRAGSDLLRGLDQRPAQRGRALMGECPRRALPSELRTLGASPAHEHRCLAVGKRVTSPTSAMISIAVYRPGPDLAQHVDAVIIFARSSISWVVVAISRSKSQIRTSGCPAAGAARRAARACRGTRGRLCRTGRSARARSRAWRGSRACGS